MIRVLLMLTMLLLSTFLTKVTAQDSSAKRVPGEIIIHHDDRISADEYLAALNLPSEVSLKRVLKTERKQLVVHFDESLIEPTKLLEEIKSHELTFAAQYNYKINFRDRTPNDPLFGEQWNMFKIDAQEIWCISQGGLNWKGDTITIAVLDSGCDIDHEDLVNNIFINHGEIPDDGIDNDGNGYIDDSRGWRVRSDGDNHVSSNHGTSVTGIIGAQGDNNIGVAGVNWHSKLLIISDFDEVPEIIEAYEYVLKMRRDYNDSNGAKGAYIVSTNASFGIPYFLGGIPANHPLWCAVYDDLGNEGIINAAATINESVDIDQVGDVPSGCSSEFIISVTNTDRSDVLGNSGFGATTIDLSGPGTGSYTTEPQDSYGVFGGTSAATPHVAGAIALLHSLKSARFDSLVNMDPLAATRKLKAIILESVDPVNSLDGKTVTGGRLNMGAALDQFIACFGNESQTLTINELAPNPVADVLNYKYSTRFFDQHRLEIYASDGRLVRSEILNPPLFEEQAGSVDVSDLATGVYILSILRGESVISGKFVKANN